MEMMKMHTSGPVRATVLFLSVIMLLALAAPAHAAEMKDYCVVPPYVKTGLKPNILILMDNSERNGGPAYNQDTDPTIVNDGLTGMMLYNPATSEAAGLFQSNLWYTYDGNGRFAPDPDGVFEGNLLNWMTTSMYDIITSVIVGGKSASRQTNAHTLMSFASGTWNAKAYIYQEDASGAQGPWRACMFKVDSAGPTVAVSDIQEYLDLGIRCGLVGDQDKGHYPTKPHVSYTFSFSAALDAGPGGFARALPEGAGDGNAPAGEDGYILSSIYSVLNSLMGLLAEPAEAAPFKISVPWKDNVTYNADMYYPFTLRPATSGGSGLDSYVTWEVTAGALPTGIIINTTNGLISGTPDLFSEIGVHTVTITATDSLAGASVDRILMLDLQGVPLSILQPVEGGRLHDAIWFEDYTGYYPIARGGNPFNYTWRVLNTLGVEDPDALPPGLSINPVTGLISGLHDPAITKYAMYHNFQLEVDDGYSSDIVNAKILSLGGAFRVLPFPTGSQLPDAVMGVKYVPAKFLATGGTGDYTWYTIWGALPKGLTLDKKTGVISGTPIVQGEGTVSFYLSVYDGLDPGTGSYKANKIVGPFTINIVRPEWMNVKLTWPGAPMANTFYGYDMGQVSHGVSYPLPDGWRKAMAQSGDEANYIWLQASPYTGEYGLSNIGMAIDPGTGIIYTPVGNPYKSLPWHPEALVPDSFFPGFVNVADYYSYIDFYIAVTDGSSSDYIMATFYVNETTATTPPYGDFNNNGKIDCWNFEDPKCMQISWPLTAPDSSWQ
jgi:hypothetical protein